jgi:hypothetical protein
MIVVVLTKIVMHDYYNVPAQGEFMVYLGSKCSK